MTTGFDLVKSRLPVVGIHHEGIKYVFHQQKDDEEEVEEEGVAPPENLSFLEVLAEFSFRLLDIDKHGSKGV